MAHEVLLPRLGWTMEEGTLAEWLKKDGDAVTAGEILFTVESEKALNEVEAAESGVLRIPPDSPKPGTVVPVGALLAYILAPGESLPQEHPQQAAGGAPPVALGTSRAGGDAGEGASRSAGSEHLEAVAQPSISPRARRVAGELGVDWTQLKGSGRTGRVVERDVRAAAGIAAPATAAQPGGPEPSAGAVRPPDGQTRAPMSPTRRTIAQRMADSARTTAPVTLTTEIDATELVRLRAQLKNDPAASRQPIPSFTDLFVKLCAHALREHPALNSRLEGDEVVASAAAHIGVAVDTDRGLLVPVVRDAQAKTLREIAGETQALVARARDGKAAPRELSGGTFTVTNLGMYDIDAFTPIINLPECAVLGVGRARLKQAVLDEEGHASPRHMLTLSLTFDHRLVDGAPAARFLQRVKQLAEQPYLWLVT